MRIGQLKWSWGCVSQRWLPRLLWYKGRQQTETYQSIHISGPDPLQMTILWALPYPFEAQDTNCTWTAPEWAGHCTQQSFRVEDCPFTFTPTHTFAHHIPMLQQIFTSLFWHHGQTDIQHAPPLLENRFSWLTCIWTNMGTYGKWSASKVKVIPVAFTFHSLHYTCSHFQIWITGIQI